jgi:hypothetical protein
MLVEVSLFASALVLGVIAAVVGHRRPPTLDAERLFKVAQATLLWGTTERSGGDEKAWVAAVERGVSYHPAGRLGWLKLADPAAALPVPALSGERSLVDDLATLAPGSARLERMFACEAAREALLGDPAALGPEWEPVAWLGHGCTWEGLAAWDGPVRAAVARRLGHLRVVLVAPAGEGIEELAATLDGVAGARALRWSDGPAEALAEALAGEVADLAERLAVVTFGAAGPSVLAALEANPALRDMVALVLFVGCPLAGVEGDAPAGLAVAEREAWLAEHFRQEALDTELKRATPYAMLARLDREIWPAGVARVPWARQRLDEPPVPPSGRRPVAVVDLGAAPAGADTLPAEVFGRSLLLLAAFLLGAGAPRA